MKDAASWIRQQISFIRAEIKTRHKLFALAVAILLVFLAARAIYFHGKWRVVEVKKDGYEVAIPAPWFDFTHQGYRSTVGKYLSREYIDFPFIIRTDVEVLRTENDSTTVDVRDALSNWMDTLIRLEAGENISEIQQLTLESVPDPAYGRTFDVKGYHCRIVVFSHGERLYAIEMLSARRRGARDNAVFDKILRSFTPRD